METLQQQVQAINEIFSVFSTTGCSHPVLERKPDDFDYCFFCGEFVPTVDD